MGYINLKEKEVVIDIESGETSNGAGADPAPSSKRGKKKTLGKLVSGVLGFTELGGFSRTLPVVTGDEIAELIVDKNDGRQTQELVPLVGRDLEKEKPKGGRAKKPPKPPRPPRGPSLDAADLRMVREIAKIATLKRERVERIKALKKEKAEKSSMSPSSSPTTTLPKSSRGSVLALIITVLVFLAIIYQGFSSINRPSIALAGAPGPAPETKDSPFVHLHLHYVRSIDGAAPSLAPPKSTGHFTSLVQILDSGDEKCRGIIIA